MGRYKLDRVLCIDTEWTCWDGAPPPGMRPEIIEIGIVEADPKSCAILREARFLVRPRVSEVSEYCTRLTGLTPREVARGGRPLGEALRTLAKNFGPANKLTTAWGDDWSGLQDECAACGVGNPFPRENFVDLGKSYALLMGTAKRPGLSATLERLGIAFEGRPHRAVDDARNTLRLYFEVARAAREAFPEPSPPSPR